MSLPPAPPYEKSKSRFLSKKLASRLEPCKESPGGGEGARAEADHQCCLPRCPAGPGQPFQEHSTRALG